MNRSRASLVLTRSLGAVLAIGGCATGSGEFRVEPLPDEASLTAAQERAPDLFAAAELAEHRAGEADARGEAAIAGDLATRARLLYEAAVVEAERVTLEAQRVALDAELEAAARETAALEQERAALAESRARQEAAQVASEQARLALELAEEDEARRERREPTATSATHRAAAAALKERVQLLLAAARALGADDDRVDALLAQLAAVRGSPTEALRVTDDVHGQALAILGEARRSHPVGAPQQQALRLAAEERGLTTEQMPTGLAVRGNFLRGRRVHRGRAEALAQLIVAHPHGPVQLRGPRTQTQELQGALVEMNVPTERLRLEEDDALEVLFLAYGGS